jgi:hypothetical protein
VGAGGPPALQASEIITCNYLPKLVLLADNRRSRPAAATHLTLCAPGIVDFFTAPYGRGSVPGGQRGGLLFMNSPDYWYKSPELALLGARSPIDLVGQEDQG